MSHLKNRLAVLGIQPFRWYVFSCTLAMFGNGLTYIAMTWILLSGPHQVTAIAILMAAFWLPSIILGPLAGVLVDRLSRKSLLLWCNGLRTLVLFIFWWNLSETPNAASVYLLSALCGTLLSVYVPASMTLVREIVPKKSLLYANATADMAYELGALCGMGGAGVIIALTSMRSAFLINALFYLAAVLCTFKVSYPFRENLASQKESFLRELILGLVYLKARRKLMLVYAVQMLFFVCYIPKILG